MDQNNSNDNNVCILREQMYFDAVELNKDDKKSYEAQSDTKKEDK